MKVHETHQLSIVDYVRVDDKFITIDEAVELTGIPTAELVTHLELFRDPIPGIVRVSTRALEKWVARKSALSMLDENGRGAPVLSDGADFEDERAELGRKLEQVAVISDSVRRADNVINTACAIVLLERLRRELVASGEKDNVPILGRVAWRLRASLKAVHR